MQKIYNIHIITLYTQLINCDDEFAARNTSNVIAVVAQWLGSYDFFSRRKNVYVESWVAFIVVCVQTSPYYVELVIHKNATYTHKHFTGNSVGVARFICILQPFMTFYENASLLFLISNINCDSVISFEKSCSLG